MKRPCVRGLLILAVFLTACAPQATASAPRVVRVQYTLGANAWLNELYDCAGSGLALSADQRVASALDPYTADLLVRIGEPGWLAGPAFQLGSEEIQVVVHPQNPLAEATRPQLLQLFTGQASNWSALGGPDLAVQVWAFDPGEDIQRAFDAIALNDAPVTSLANLATDPDALAYAVSQDPGAIGILPRHWVAGNVRALRLPAELSAALTIPVLVLTPFEPDQALSGLIACAQAANE
jgi:hypothetical protein